VRDDLQTPKQQETPAPALRRYGTRRFLTAVRSGSTLRPVRMAPSDRAHSIWLYERVCGNSPKRQTPVERPAERHGMPHSVAVRFAARGP
jgi:hypothetical protein